MNSAIDNITPPNHWRFDDCVTAAFQNMLERSIPGYKTMRDACFSVGAKFVQDKTDIVDLGCSRGEALQPFVEKFGAYNRYIAIDVSGPMLDACRERFSGYIRSNGMDVIDLDLRRQYPPARASLTLAVLTIQFTPIEYRQQILRQVYEHTVSGGAFILVEKVIGATAPTDKLLTACYFEHKRSVGYTEEQIQRKRLSLEGVLAPVSTLQNEQMLSAAGFKYIECFWRYLNFCGWVAIRE